MDGIIHICDRIMACCVNILQCLRCPCFQESHVQEEEIRMRQFQIAQDLDEAMRLPLLERNLSRHSSEDNLQLELQYEDEFAARNSGILKKKIIDLTHIMLPKTNINSLIPPLRLMP